MTNTKYAVHIQQSRTVAEIDAADSERIRAKMLEAYLGDPQGNDLVAAIVGRHFETLAGSEPCS